MQKFLFLEGLNKDDDERTIKPSQYRNALNIRITDSQSGKRMCLTNIKGTTAVSVQIPVDMYTEIGSVDDKLGQRVFYFLHAATPINHRIMEYNYNTNVVKTLVSGTQLNFKRDKKIFNPSFVDNKWLYFTDNSQEAKNVNVDTGELYDMAKDAVVGNIICNYATDINQNINNLRGRSWQFAVMYKYKDGSKSSLSHFSNIPLRSAESILYFGGVIPTTQDNAIDVTFNTGSNQVDEIMLCVRSKVQDTSPSQFFVTKTFKKDQVGQTVTHRFFNNEFERFVENIDIAQVGSFFPRTFKDLTFGYGNRMYMSNVRTGYDLPTPDMETSFNYRAFPEVEPSSLNANVSGSGLAATTFSVAGNVPQPSPPQFFSRGMLTFDPTRGRFESYVLFQGVNAVSTAIFRPYPQLQDKPTQLGTSALERRFVAPPTISPLPQVPASFQLPNVDSSGYGVRLTQVPTLNDELHYLQKKEDVFYRDILFSGTVALGDKVKITISGQNTPYLGLNASTPENFSQVYEVVSITNNVRDFLKSVVDTINNTQINPTARGISAVLDTASDTIRIHYGLYPYTIGTTEKYYVMDIQSVSATVSNTFLDTGSLPPQYTLKEGRKHEFAIAYSDKKGRMTTALLAGGGVPNFRNKLDRGGLRGAVGFNLQIGHAAPTWASQYHILHRSSKSDFIEIPAYLEWSGTKLTVDLNMLFEFGRKFTSFVRGYSFERGDTIRIISTFSGTRVIDAPRRELKFAKNDNSGATVELEADYPNNLNGTVNGQAGVYIIQIEKANSNELTKPFNETGHTFPCINGLHLVTDNYGASQTQANPASITIDDYGDCFYRVRIFNDFEDKVTNPNIVSGSSIVEDESASDFYVDEGTGAGRPNVVDDNFKEMQRDTAIVFTEPYVVGSTINGLSTVYDSSIEVYGNQFGSIQRIINKGRRLDVYMERRVGAVGLQLENVLSTAGGVEYRTDKILSQMEFYAAEYGIGEFAECFSDYSNSDYFVDNTRGTVCRKAENGITPISEYRCSSLFQDLLTRPDLKGVRTSFNRLYQELMVLFNYDKTFTVNEDYTSSDYEFNNSTRELTFTVNSKFEYYKVGDKVEFLIINSVFNPQDPTATVYAKLEIKSISDLSNAGGFSQGDTRFVVYVPQDVVINTVFGFQLRAIRFPKRINYTFSEPLNSWVSELSLRPNWIDELNIGTISIENGIPYKNDDSETRNTFLGDSYQSEVELVCNENPSYPKRFKTIQQESNKKWTVEIETNTPSGVNRTLFQKSDLTEANLKHISNMFVGGFWKDINTVNVQNPKFEGNDMRGQFAKIKLKNNSTEKLETFSVGVNYIATNASNEE